MAFVWVRLSGLPLEFWDERILKSIDESFLHFFVVDMVTLRRSWLVFARFSINVAVGTSLPKSIMLTLKWGKKVQPIIYENVGVVFPEILIIWAFDFRL